jgi:hypothetical protein
LILIFIVVAAFIWSWLKDPTEPDIRAVMNPAQANKLMQDAEEEGNAGFERHMTMLTEGVPDANNWMKVFTFDNVRQSVSKTYERVYQEPHMVSLFFVAGFTFNMLNYFLSTYSMLQTKWETWMVFTYACLFVGCWFWGWWYGQVPPESHDGLGLDLAGGKHKMKVITLNMVCNILGYIFYIILNWYEWEFGKFWWMYIIALLMWMSICGLQTLAQLVVADLMPRGKVDIKLARCFGAYVLVFGLGALFDVMIFQILTKNQEYVTKAYAHRVETFAAVLLFIIAIFRFHKYGPKHFTPSHHTDVVTTEVVTHHDIPVHTTEHYTTEVVNTDPHYIPSTHLA